jgi:hypothetical protein
MGILGRLMGTAENTARGGRATGRPVRGTGKTNTRNVGGRMTRGLRRSQPAPPPSGGLGRLMGILRRR